MKISNELAMLILATPGSSRQVADAIGVDIKDVTKVQRSPAYKSVPTPTALAEAARARKVSSRVNRLARADAIAILAAKGTATQAALAEKYGCDQSMIHFIFSRKSWKSITQEEVNRHAEENAHV